MAVTHQPIFIQAFNLSSAAFTNADSANTKKTVFTFGANGSKCIMINATSTDTVNRVAQVWRTNGGTSWLLCSSTVVAGAGNDGTTASADLLQTMVPVPFDSDGQQYIGGISGDTLQVSFTTQVASGKEIDVTALGGDL